MLSLFKKQTQKESVIFAEKAVQPQKSVNELVQEIHETFYTEVDRLLQSAKIKHSLKSEKQDLIDKANRLKMLDFYNAKEVKDCSGEEERLYNLRSENYEKDSLVRAIEYFSFKYPNYKFITEESVKKICAKYGLVYGKVSKYKGDVPDKNLADIENFRIEECDKCCQIETEYSSNVKGNIKYISCSDYNSADSHFIREYHGDGTVRLRQYYNRCPLEIAAPVKDFHMGGMEVKDFQITKIEIPDPVVLQPVYFEGNKHYLIVTAWGEEASDELVVNHRFN